MVGERRFLKRRRRKVKSRWNRMKRGTWVDRNPISPSKPFSPRPKFLSLVLISSLGDNRGVNH